MNCHDLRTRLDPLDDASNGVLTPEILAHLEDCAACARYQERLAAIITPSSVLPREISPPRDLWSDIASRLDTHQERKIRRTRYFLPLAAAAGIAAILATVLLSLSPRPHETVAALPIQARAGDPIPARSRLPAEMVEIGFVQTRTLLMKRFEARKGHVAPERVAVVERSLSSLDSAVEDIRAALERDPYNASLLLKLSHARRRELRVLRQVVL